MYDAVIIGAGPVGGYLARELCSRNHSVLIIEEHDEVGRPFQCAGLVNPGAMKRVDLYDTVLSEIWGANIHSPEGTVVSIGDPARVRTFSVCRKLFDEAVVMQSIKNGAEILLCSKPKSVQLEIDRVNMTVEAPNGPIEISTKLLCGADGAHSWVRKRFRMGRPKENMIGFQIEVSGYENDSGRLDMYTGKSVAPGFFAWAIPSGETTRIGTWSKGDLLDDSSSEQCLVNLMKSPLWDGKFDNCREIGRFCGLVPSGMVKKTMIERVALFGDAAGICKPTTGGGIGPGFKQVDLLIEDLSKAIIENDLSAKKMEKISRKMRDFQRDQRRKRALRDAFLTEISDEELEDIFRVWAKPEVTDMINKFGEIENPIPLGMRMLKDVPEFRKLAGRAAKAVLWG